MHVTAACVHSCFAIALGLACCSCVQCTMYIRCLGFSLVCAFMFWKCFFCLHSCVGAVRLHSIHFQGCSLVVVVVGAFVFCGVLKVKIGCSGCFDFSCLDAPWGSWAVPVSTHCRFWSPLVRSGVDSGSIRGRSMVDPSLF